MLSNSRFYNVQGECRQLEFSVELALLVHSTQPDALLKFDDFQRRKQASRGIAFEKSAEEVAKRDMLEKRTVHWLEAIPKPTIIIKNIVEEDENVPNMMEVQSENGREEDTREEEQVPEDPAQILPMQQMAVTRHAVPSHRIFTVLNAEESIPVKASLTAQPQFRQKRVTPIEQFALKQPIRWDLPTEQRRRNREATIVEQKMQIWAFLGEEGESEYNTADEFLLWELCLSNGRLLHVQPDLGQCRLVSRRQQAFLATLAFDQQLLFDSLSAEAIGPQHEWLPFECEEEEEENAPFDVPEGNADYWLHYFVEISKARDFTKEYLRVEWLFDLPENMRLMQPVMTKNSTQQCATKGQGREDVAHFGHLLQFSLNRRPASSADCLKAGLVWPRLLLRVIAEDSWGRFFIEGYASLSLPASPGEEFHRLECWRITDGGDSKADALRNAHMGQAVDLADFKVAGARDSQGLCNEASGNLEILVRCMHQSRHFLTREMVASLRYSRMVQRVGLYGGLHWRIARVLEEFERARRQLLALSARRVKEAGLRRTM